MSDTSQFLSDLQGLLEHTNQSGEAAAGFVAAIDAQITRRLEAATLTGSVTISGVTGISDNVDGHPVTGDLTGTITGGGIA